jgi:hypothetical protein
MAARTTEAEILALEGCISSKEYCNRHSKLFKDFYKDSVMSGSKRAATIWYKREKYLAEMKKKQHMIEIKNKAVKEAAKQHATAAPIADDGEILIKILQELRIHTKQMVELLQIAKQPKNKNIIGEGTLPPSVTTRYFPEVAASAQKAAMGSGGSGANK